MHSASDALPDYPLGNLKFEILVKALKDKNRHVRQYAAENLGKLADNRAISPLIEALGGDEPMVVAAAADALVKIGPVTIELVIIALQHKNSEVRYRAASVLGRLKASIALEPLITALQDDYSRV